MCPALWMGVCTQLPLKGHPMGVWVGCRCSPPQPSHPLDRLGALQRGITHHRQLLQAVKWHVLPTAEPGRARRAPAVPENMGLVGAGCDQGWHPRSWRHLLTCPLSTLHSRKSPFGFSRSFSKSQLFYYLLYLSLILGAAWFWSHLRCLCFWEVLCQPSVSQKLQVDALMPARSCASPFLMQHESSSTDAVRVSIVVSQSLFNLVWNELSKTEEWPNT